MNENKLIKEFELKTKEFWYVNDKINPNFKNWLNKKGFFIHVFTGEDGFENFEFLEHPCKKEHKKLLDKPDPKHCNDCIYNNHKIIWCNEAGRAISCIDYAIKYCKYHIYNNINFDNNIYVIYLEWRDKKNNHFVQNIKIQISTKLKDKEILDLALKTTNNDLLYSGSTQFKKIKFDMKTGEVINEN